MLYDWYKLEDIYASLYHVRCNNKFRRETRNLVGYDTTIASCTSCLGVFSFMLLVMRWYSCLRVMLSLLRHGMRM